MNKSQAMSELEWGKRDIRGQWTPDPLPEPGPLFQWPLRLRKIVKYLLHRKVSCGHLTFFMRFLPLVHGISLPLALTAQQHLPLDGLPRYTSGMRHFWYS